MVAGTFEVLFVFGFMSLFAFLVIFAQYMVEEVTIDLKKKELRKTYLLFNKVLSSKLIYPKIDQMYFAWMEGVQEREDEPSIYGYELVAYKNKYHHKDLMFFEKKTTTENLSTIFKEKLNVDIRDRIEPFRFWTHAI